MKLSIKDIAALLAAVICADGVYDEAERITLDEIADAFSLDASELKRQVEEELERINELDEEKVHEYIRQSGENLGREESMLVFEALMQIALCDGELCREELRNLLDVAGAIGLNAEDVVLLIADMVKSEPDMIVTIK